MKSTTQLDYAIFQLTPTRTRCELYVAAQGITYKLASGLLKPFVAHLRTAEEQLARGGYSIRLEPPDPDSASWFTKGTMERFVRFVSTPEVLERVSTVEGELIELEETINLQTNEASEASEAVQTDDQCLKIAPSAFSGGKTMVPANLDKPALPVTKTKRDSVDGGDTGVEENSKQRLLKALDARRLMLQKEQGMAFARAMAAGFGMEHMGDLVVFAECFGANRLREACIKFMTLCKKRQEAGLWIEELDLAAAEAASAHADMSFMGIAGETMMGSYLKSREYPDTWSEMHGGDMKFDDVRRASFPSEGRMFNGDDQAGAEKLSRRGSLEDSTGDYWQLAASLSQSGMRATNGPGMMADLNGEYSPLTHARNRPNQVGGRNPPTPEELQAAAAAHLSAPGSGMGFQEENMANGEYRDPETGRTAGLVRGHPVMGAWQGQPQPQFMQNVHSHSPHGAMHPSLHKHLESPYLFGGPGRGAQPGLPYNPHYLGSPFLQTAAYPDSSSGSPWQLPEAGPNWMGRLPPAPPAQYWQSNQGYGDTPRPNTREYLDGALHSTQHHDANYSHMPSRDEEQGPKTGHGTDLPQVKQLLPGGNEAFVNRDAQETVYSPTPNHSSDYSQRTTDPRTPEYINPDEKIESSLEIDAESPAEMTRRLPRRSSSPSRRSSSPMRKVQIGRSGPRRSGMVVIRNINYIAPNSQDRSTKGDNGAGSSSDWSEEGDLDASDQEETLKSKAESVRVSVQDVIGLFENKKRDSSDTRRKSSKKESRRGSSKKAVLSRWTDSGDLSGDTNDEQQEEDSRLTTNQDDDLQKHAPGDEVKDDAESASKPSDEKQAEHGKDLFVEEAPFFPKRVGQQRLNTSVHDVAELESEAGNHLQTVNRGRQVTEEELFVLTGREGADQHHLRSRAVPLHDSEFTTKGSELDTQTGLTSEEILMLPERDGVNERSTALFGGTEVLAEQQGPAPQKRPISDDSFVISERAGLGDTLSTWKNRMVDQDLELATNQNGDSEQQLVDKRSLDDSFIVPNRTVAQEGANIGWRMALNMEAEMPFDENLDTNLEHVSKNGHTSDSFEPADLYMVPERNKEAAGRSWNTAVDYDMQLLAVDMADNLQQDHDQQSVVDESESPKGGGSQEQGDEKREAKSKEPGSNKRTEREAKAKAMQELLEKRKAGTAKNSRSDKPNPLVEAQLRAEKLRAYKASLQKSKKEKEEEERKRIEDLKNQRRERIAARSSPGSVGTQSPSSTPRGVRSQTAPTRPSLTVSKSSPTSHRIVALAASSPLESINGSSSLSPRMPRSKGSSGPGIPRTSQKALTASLQSKTAENPLSRSVPSLTELRKEGRKTPAVRASTGSQRLSQLKASDKAANPKSAKDASPINSNGHVDDRKRNGSTTVRKGISAANELKGMGLSSVKASKTSSDSSKQQKTSMNGTTLVGQVGKPSLQKGSGLGPGAVATKQKASSEDRETINKTIEEAPLSSFLPQENEVEEAKLPATLETVEAGESPTIDEAGERAGAEPRFIPIRAPASTGSGAISTIPDEVSSTSQMNNRYLESTETVEIFEDPKEETSDMGTAFQGSCLPHDSQLEYHIPVRAELQSDLNEGELEHQDSTDAHPLSPGVEDYRAPIAQMSVDNDSATDVSSDVNANKAFSAPTTAPQLHGTSMSNLPTTEQYNPPIAPLTYSPAATPSKNLPRLQEAIQQAHSPEASPVKTEIPRSRKKWGDTGSQKTPKEHAKGFKRLLKFGRKSSRSSGPNSSDWVSASTTSEGDEDGDEVRDLPSSNGKNYGIGSSLDSIGFSEHGTVRSSIPAPSTKPHLKPQEDHISGSSSTKASRSFFSLSSFRSKGGEGKTR